MSQKSGFFSRSTQVLGLYLSAEQGVLVRARDPHVGVDIDEVLTAPFDPSLGVIESLSSLVDAWPKAYFSRTVVRLVLPEEWVQSRLLLLPKLSEWELQKVIRYQLGLGPEMSCSFMSLGERDDQEAQLCFWSESDRLVEVVDFFLKRGARSVQLLPQSLALMQVMDRDWLGVKQRPLLILSPQKTELSWLLFSQSCVFFRESKLEAPMTELSLDETCRLNKGIKEGLLDAVNECRSSVSYLEGELLKQPIEGVLLLGDFLRVTGVSKWVSEIIERPVIPLGVDEGNLPLNEAQKQSLLDQRPVKQMGSLMAMAVASMGDCVLDLIPVKKKYEVKDRRLVLGLILLGLSWVLAVGLWRVDRHYEGQVLGQEVSRLGQQVSQLKREIAELSADVSGLDQQSERLTILQTHLAKSIPVDDFLDQISGFAYDDLYLTDVRVVYHRVSIWGVTQRQSGQDGFNLFLDKIRQIPYLKEIDYQMTKRPQGELSEFKIEGVFDHDQG